VRVAAGLLAALASTIATAQDRPYEVRIEGAGDLTELLERHLPVASRREELAGQRERLRLTLARTPDEARALLAAEGYLDARVTSTMAEPEGGGTRILTLEVALGAPVRVRGVDLRFRGAIRDAGPDAPPTPDAIRGGWTLKPDARFRQADWEDAKRRALRTLLAQRYPTARLAHSQATLDPIARSADLVVELDSGPAFRFGRLEVVGMQRYPESVVHNLNPIRPGTPYSQKALADLQTRLYGVPYFTAVTISADPRDGVDPEALPIRVEVSEADRYRFESGIGFSTNTGLRAQVQVTDHDLFDRGWRWRNLVRYEERAQRGESSLVFPVRSDGWQDETSIVFDRTDLQGFLVESYNWNWRHSKAEGRIERAFTLQAIGSREFPDGTTAQYKRALVPGYAWRYRLFDDLLDPREGFEVGWQVGGGSKAVFSDQNFIRAFGRAVLLLPLGRDNSLVLRAEGGAVEAPSRDGIPAQLLFRAGGDQSLRGYKYQSIGVREGDAVVGGRYMAVGGAELIRWVQPKLGVAAFFEIGDVFEERTKIVPNRGYGVGVRWRSPVGPVNFDLAYGEAVRAYRAHFSIGFVF